MKIENFTTDELINELVNRGYLHAFWNIQDIESRCQEKGIELSREQRMEIAEEISNDWDASIGINWDKLDDHIDQYCELHKIPVPGVDTLAQDMD